MLTLVHAPRSRSSRFLWLLEEIGEPYDIQYVSIRRVDGAGALDPTNPHPHGKVPFLKDHASTVFEQTAIALYLADKFPEAHLGPAIGDLARGAFLTALAYYSGVLEPAFTSKFMKVFVARVRGQKLGNPPGWTPGAAPPTRPPRPEPTLMPPRLCRLFERPKQHAPRRSETLHPP
jgi:glutathione S-transferase